MQKLTHQELLARQSSQSESKFPLVVILNNIRSLYNVGSIFRTADGVGVEKLWLCGITGTPETERQRIEKTALGAEKRVNWEHAQDILSVVQNYKNQSYQIVLLEQIKESIPYQEFEPKFPVCLIVGNEITGISDELLALSDAAIEIEMTGHKCSLNVTVAFGVVAYHFRNSFKSAVRS